MRRVYRVTSDARHWFIEANSIATAIEAWAQAVRDESEEDRHDQREPDLVEFVGMGTVAARVRPEAERPATKAETAILDELVGVVFRGKLVHYPTAIQELPDRVRHLIDAANIPASDRLIRQGFIPASAVEQLPEALSLLGVLAAIAIAYDANELEPRKNWVQEGVPYFDSRRPDQIELLTTRGARSLLTLADCQAARAAIMAAKKVKAVQP